MTARPQLPGTAWFLWMRNPALRVGAVTWMYVSAAFIAWQLIAYGIPRLERYGGVRDFLAGAFLLLLLMVPVFRFHDEPAKLFISGLTAWALLTLTYVLAEMIFPLLETRMGVFQIFTLGAVSYILIAVVHWVFLMCAEARHRHMAQAGRAISSEPRQRPR